MTVVANAPAHQPSLRGPAILLSLASLMAVAFFAMAAAPYFLSSGYNAEQYTGRRGALLVHIIFGTIALFTGPVQLWLGIAERRVELHRKLGMAYLIAVVVSAGAAYIIAMSPSGGWIFGSGLIGLATTWLATTTMAFLAIKRHLIEQHKEWMIRSYVVTFGFVVFRIGTMVAGVAAPDQVFTVVQIMAWAAWTLPLVATEVVLQGRKILRVAA